MRLAERSMVYRAYIYMDNFEHRAYTCMDNLERIRAHIYMDILLEHKAYVYIFYICGLAALG
jgi:hypothetical protein